MSFSATSQFATFVEAPTMLIQTSTARLMTGPANCEMTPPLQTPWPTGEGRALLLPADDV